MRESRTSRGGWLTTHPTSYHPSQPLRLEGSEGRSAAEVWIGRRGGTAWEVSMEEEEVAGAGGVEGEVWQGRLDERRRGVEGGW